MCASCMCPYVCCLGVYYYVYLLAVAYNNNQFLIGKLWVTGGVRVIITG